jgi:hypothetical protein
MYLLLQGTVDCGWIEFALNSTPEGIWPVQLAELPLEESAASTGNLEREDAAF